jgi:hypothetical protein
VGQHPLTQLQYYVNARSNGDGTWHITSYDLDHDVCLNCNTPDRLAGKRMRGVQSTVVKLLLDESNIPVVLAEGGNNVALVKQLTHQSLGMPVGNKVARRIVEEQEHATGEWETFEYAMLPTVFQMLREQDPKVCLLWCVGPPFPPHSC